MRSGFGSRGRAPRSGDAGPPNKPGTTTATFAIRTSSLEDFIVDTMKDVASRAEGKSGIEGQTTRKIEQVTASIPSSTWLLLAGASVAGSFVLKMMGRDSTANFVGEWAPTILLLGIYNKIVKVMGSERQEARAY
jgi:hypothetical protein